MGMKHRQEAQENEQVRMQNETETPARDRASITTGRLVYGGYRIPQESTCYTSNLQASFPGETAQLALAEGAFGSLPKIPGMVTHRRARQYVLSP
jgi:hypothetical protein